MRKSRYRRVVDRNGYVRINGASAPLEHMKVVELVLGRPIKRPNMVHHVNGDTTDNSHSNLVVCENQAYHFLLHARTTALKECGNPSLRKCSYCRQYDDPKNLIQPAKKQGESDFWHQSCRNTYQNNYYRERTKNNIPIGRKGILNPRAKLSESDVIEIREAVKSGERFCNLAKLYGVDKTSIRYAALGKTWTHI